MRTKPYIESLAHEIYNSKSIAYYQQEKLEQQIAAIQTALLTIEEKQEQQHQRSIEAIQTALLTIEEKQEQQHQRSIEAIQTALLTIEEKQEQQHQRSIEAIRAFVRKEYATTVSQFLHKIEQMTPQKAAESTKAISEAKPPKREKAEPMSMEEAREILKEHLL